MSAPEGGDIENLETPEDEVVDTNYKPPPEKTIEEILDADKEDESLRKYKETLLGEAKEGKVIVGMLIISYFFLY